MSVMLPNTEAYAKAGHLALQIVAVNGTEVGSSMLEDYFVAFGRAVKAVSGDDRVRELLPTIVRPPERRIALASVDGERVDTQPAA